MARIKIDDLSVTESESLLYDLNNVESMAVFGGEDTNFNQLMKFSTKTLEFLLTAYAINTIAFLASSFNSRD
ncbi:MAG TPA: hypothetical protein VK184_04650 [Nostocaceae cyanobacterium]|nr:hypothetical protein [Nostocaceae cyanobacterium]